MVRPKAFMKQNRCLVDNTTNGNATYLSAEEARSSKLIYVNPLTNHSYTTNIRSGQRRNSIRITSKERYPVGSLWVADIYHLPTGCSLWPAWWSFPPNWPRGGQATSAIERVNRLPHNRMGPYTFPGCMKDQLIQPPNAYVNNTDCSYTYDNNQDCLISDLRDGSYVQSFNDARGGVWVTEFAEFASEGISYVFLHCAQMAWNDARRIWFSPRFNIPANLKTANVELLDTKELGSLIGNWPASSCDIDQYFEAQNLVFTIALCGDVSCPNLLVPSTCVREFQAAMMQPIRDALMRHLH